MIPVSPSQIGFRNQTTEDEPFLFRLYASTRREELDQAQVPESFREPLLRQQFTAMTEGYRTRFGGASWRVIEFDGRPVGRIIVLESPAEIRVVDLALLEEVRGRGIGSWILQDLQAAAVAQGKPVRLRAFLGTRTEKWYRRLGFTPIEEDGLRVHLEWIGGSGGTTL